MIEPSFLFGQFLGGLTSAMFLFLIASGLSLVFGVMRVLNFAHGSFYMVGASVAWQVVQWLAPMSGGFWLAVLAAALGVEALLGGVVERLLLRHLYGREELYQLLFTYALVLILGDAAKAVWGTRQLSVSRPPILAGSLEVLGTTLPIYNLFIMLIGPAIALVTWLLLSRSTGPAGWSERRRSTVRCWGRSVPMSGRSTPACSSSAPSSLAFRARWLRRSRVSYRAWTSRLSSRRSLSW